MLRLNNLVEVPPGRYRYYQEETQSEFGPYSNFQTLVDAVRVHRRSNRIEPKDDELAIPLEAELQDWLCRSLRQSGYYCHENGQPVRRTVLVDDEGEENGSSYDTGWDGSAKWAELHLYALNKRPSSAIRYLWLETFTASLPCGGCRKHWRALVKERPLPALATPEEFFAWTVDRHNDVNDKLGYPIITLDAALALWSTRGVGSPSPV